MVSTLFLALALMLIIEGILPFLAPQMWRETFRRAIALADGQIRFMGLASMTGGLILLFLAK